MGHAGHRGVSCSEGSTAEWWRLRALELQLAGWQVTATLGNGLLCTLAMTAVAQWVAGVTTRAE